MKISPYPVSRYTSADRKILLLIINFVCYEGKFSKFYGSSYIALFLYIAITPCNLSNCAVLSAYVAGDIITRQVYVCMHMWMVIMKSRKLKYQD